MLNALAWPVATLVLAALFRREFGAALGRLGQLKYRDLEVTFRDNLREAESLAKSIASAPAMPGAPARILLEVEESEGAELCGVILAEPKSPTATRQVARGRDALDRLAARSPRDAVLEAWSEVGQALVRAATALGDRRTPAPVRAEDASRYLAGRGWMPGPEARLVEQLRNLRDRAADLNAPAPTADEARRYLDLALPVAARLDGLG